MMKSKMFKIILKKDINQLKLKKNSNKSYVLLNSNFLKEFPFKENITMITFYLSYQNIHINL